MQIGSKKTSFGSSYGDEPTSTNKKPIKIESEVHLKAMMKKVYSVDNSTFNAFQEDLQDDGPISKRLNAMIEKRTQSIDRKYN